MLPPYVARARKIAGVQRVGGSLFLLGDDLSGDSRRFGDLAAGVVQRSAVSHGGIDFIDDYARARGAATARA